MLTITDLRNPGLVRAWYDYLYDHADGLGDLRLVGNPVRGVRLVLRETRLVSTSALDLAEARRLLDVARSDSATSYALVLFLLTTGETLATTSTLMVENLRARRGGRVLDFVTRKKKRRQVPVSPVLSDAFDRMLDERDAPAGGPLFATSDGAALSAKRLGFRIRGVGQRAGIADPRKVRARALHYTAVTELIAATGGDLRSLMEIADLRCVRNLLRSWPQPRVPASHILADHLLGVLDDGPATAADR